jgi:predicted nucleic acid-binding protein
MSGLLLDAGALIAVDRGDRRVLALLEAARDADLRLSVTAPVVSQAWRDGRRQTRLAALLKQPEVEMLPFAATDARAVGEVVRLSRHPDVVDVHITLLARQRGETVVTSDASDLRRVDPSLRVIEV